MPIAKDLEVVVDKAKVMDAIQCYKNNPGYEETLELYEEILPEFQRLVKPAAAYAFIDNTAEFAVPKARDCSKLVYCVLTLGQDICDRISELFMEGDYLQGMLVNAMGDELLAYYEQELYVRIKKEADLVGYGLTRRLVPGEEGFDLDYQQEILEWFAKDSKVHLTLTPDNALQPAKSLVYLYGADSEQLTAEIAHDCLHCDNISCYMREKTNESKVILTVIAQDGTHKIVEADRTESILKSLSQAGIFIDAPCSGKGTCGKCKIKLVSGAVQKEPVNYGKLQPIEIQAGVCLACKSYPEEDCTIEILAVQTENYCIAADFVVQEGLPLKHGFTINSLLLSELAEKNHVSLVEAINSSLGNTYRFSKRALRKISGLSKQADDSINLIISDGKIIDICPAQKTRVLGLAIDIGTTTIVIRLLDLLSGTVIDSYALLNSQRKFGADIISRIEHSAIGAGRDLKECVCQDIVKGIDALTGTLKEYIYHVVIAGNTTMLHLLLELSPESLAVYPFQTTTTDFLQFPFGEVFESSLLDCRVTMLPGISAYVGADIVAGLLQCGFPSADHTCLLIDIGTNGEMAIGNKNKLLCLATAAGPAFEGANITCGTGSVAGAIKSFTIKQDKMHFETIYDAEAVGICGSGVIDIAAACLRQGLLDRSGKFSEDKVSDGYLKITQDINGNDIIFSQQDVRELQLAKAAIRSGIEILVEKYGCLYADIDTVYLAGGFGTKLNIESAVAIGLLPHELKYKVKTVGNTSLGGACAYLLNNEYKMAINSVKVAADCIDIAADRKFNDLFIRNMSF